MSALAHYQRESDGQHARFHLRVEPDGSGLLIANATSGVRLSPSGVVMVRGLLEGRADEAIVSDVKKRFHGARSAQVAADVARMHSLLDELVEGSGRYPIVNLDDPDATVQRRALAAPLAVDLAFDDVERARPRLRTLWEAGIPQVVLVPVDGASPEGARSLVEHAEDLGLICGLRARASFLDDAALEALAMAGLDHIDLYFAGAHHTALFGEGDRLRARSHVAAAQRLELFPTAFVPVTMETLGAAEELLDGLVALGITQVTAFAIVDVEGAGLEGEGDSGLPACALKQAVATFEELADHHSIGFVWAPPIERLPREALSARAQAGPRAAGEGSVRVEADGAVLPPTGPAESAGHLDDESFARIWRHEAFRTWRESVEGPTRCAACPGLGACAVGCPESPATFARRSRR